MKCDLPLNLAQPDLGDVRYRVNPISSLRHSGGLEKLDMALLWGVMWQSSFVTRSEGLVKSCYRILLLGKLHITPGL